MNPFSGVRRVSQRIGFLPTVICAVAWVSCGVAAAATAWDWLHLWPRLARPVTYGIISVVVIGGLVSCWLIFEHIEYWRLGYRMRKVRGDDWLYDEHVSHGPARLLPCRRKVVGRGYPAQSEIRVMSEASWDTVAPDWARGRRSDILERIALGFGARRGATIVFIET